jgi:hypothetical protein
VTSLGIPCFPKLSFFKGGTAINLCFGETRRLGLGHVTQGC